MADEIMTGSLTTTVVETSEQPFIPGQQKITVVLQPEPAEVVYTPDLLPYESVPFDYLLQLAAATTAEKLLVINVETTGLTPYESKIQSIGVMNPADAGSVTVFMDESEEKMLRDFADFYYNNGYTGMIGYNVAFDYRFLFAKACRYLVKLKAWDYVTLYDVMTVMKQVKQAFVPGSNAAGSLDVWAEYLLGLKAPMTQQAELDAYAKKQYDVCREYNEYKVMATYKLYVLTNFIMG
jgi:hypothetical protein